MKGRLGRSLQYHLLLPFRNLSVPQRVLQIVRLSTSFIAFCLVITLILLLGNAEVAYVARINCAQLDVAYGLYKSLRTSISDTSFGGDNDEVLPIDLSLTDSEISILTLYTKSQVAAAPQYLLLGTSSWCLVDYQTTVYLGLIDPNSQNFTTTCQLYYDLSLFDYRGLLSSNGLTIILAYAYQSDYENDQAYYSSVASRNRDFRIFNIVTIIQAVTQAIMVIATLVVYANRGPAKDLSRIPAITLNLVAVVSMVGGVSMIAMCAVVTQEILAAQSDISSGMGSFGISMVTGRVFFALMWTAFAFLCLGMLSWTVPLWCANPPAEYVDDEYAHDTSTLLGDDFVAKPYQISRKTRKKLHKSHSRLFDEPPRTGEMVDDEETDSDILPDREELRVVDEQDEDYEIRDYLLSAQDRYALAPEEQYDLHQNEHSESELRKLGEKMARKLSTRQISRTRRPRLELPERYETRQLLYSDNPFANHQYPQEFPKMAEAGEVEGTSSTQTRNLSDPLLRTRVFLERTIENSQSMRNLNSGGIGTLKAPYLSGEATNASSSGANPKRDDEYLNPFESREDTESVLDEQEMTFLDSNHFINRLK